MANCGNRIQKKQVDWVPYTTDPNEFCTISPGGAVTPALEDHFLIEDASNGDAKACSTLQQIKDVIETEGVVIPHDCLEDRGLVIAVCPTPVLAYTFTTISLPSGEYKIDWNYFWNVSRLRRDFIAEIYLDGVLKRTHRQAVATVDTDPDEFENTCNDQQIPAAGFLCETFITEATHLIEIKIFTESTSYQVSIWDKIVYIQKVG